MNRLTIFAYETQPIVVEGLAKVLADYEDLEYLGSVSDVNGALEMLRSHRPDIVLVDQAFGLKSAFQFIADVKNTSIGSLPILWVTELAEIDCFRALQLGARGIFKKTLPVSLLIECLRAVGSGSVWVDKSLPFREGPFERRSLPHLTPREKEILQSVCAGLKNKEIAKALSITPGTVKVHMMHIFEKTGVKDRLELALQGRRLLGEPQDGMAASGFAGKDEAGPPKERSRKAEGRA
ncbi:MAG TPA: response regulator transcription factor [Bryobacteraceae bacterium]|nr:response regulator transcription factor [Bryobacteraceae bacterium]